MASSSFSLEQFRAEVLDGFGLSRNNRFEVEIYPPRGLASRYGAISQVSSLYVEQASIPQFTLLVKPLRIFGPAYQRPVASDYGGDGLPITFHVDRNMNIRKFFEDWVHLIVDPETYTVGYQEDYTSDIRIRQIDEQEDVVYEIKLIDAFPRNMNMMELNNSSTNQTHRLNVTFAYRKWERVGESQATDIPNKLLNPQVVSVDQRLPATPAIPQVRRQWNWSTGGLEENIQGSDLPPSA